MCNNNNIEFSSVGVKSNSLGRAENDISISIILYVCEIAKDEENNLYIKVHSKFHDDFFKLNRSGSSFYLGKFNPIYLNFEPKDKIVIGEPDENGFRKLTRLDENA